MEDYIITGGLDDIINIWQLENGKLEVKHKIEGHFLGVVSVAVSPDGKSKSFYYIQGLINILVTLVWNNKSAGIYLDSEIYEI